MNNYELPSPYELSQIAATLRGREAGEKPEEAIREAFALWLAAAGEIRQEKARREIEKTEELRQHTATDPSDNQLFAVKSLNSMSEVQEWLNQNAPEEDKFKTFGKFAAAWVKFDSSYATNFDSENCVYFTCSMGEIHDFLRYRKEQRLREDAERKSRKREEMRLSKDGVE
jgi:hypothetical protein